MLVLDPVVITSVLTSLFSQGVSGPVLAMPFAIIVVGKGKTEYLVQWHNFPRDQSTWEPEQNILDKRLIVNFNKSRK